MCACVRLVGATVSDTNSAVATRTGTPDLTRDRDRRYRRELADSVRLKTRLLTLGSLDKRTAAYRRTADLISQLEADVGSDPSASQRLLIQRAALTAMAIGPRG